MEAKISREFDITNDVLTEEARENIQEFIGIWASKFDIDWSRDITISIRTKHNEDGANLLIKVKDVNVEEVNTSQMNLFEAQGSNGHDKSAEKTKVRNVPASVVNDPT